MIDHWQPINDLPWDDIKLDVYRNANDHIARLTHVPTGIVAEGWDGFSTTEARHVAELELERLLAAHIEAEA